MRLHDAMRSQSTLDIIYSVRDKGVDPVKKAKGSKPDPEDGPPKPPKAKHKYRPIDRSQQGAALSGSPNIPLDSRPALIVESSLNVPNPAPPAQKAQQTMTITLKGLNRKGTTALYNGTMGTIRISLSAFPNKTAPETIEIADGVFAVKTPKTAKVKLTKEERAALPKPTQAEKIAKMEERLAKARKKLEADAAEEL